MEWSDRVGRRLKLRDLHIILAVAKSGSMGKAAAELAISQPSISKAIADVEHALGLRLFDRGPQGIEPTIYGRAVLRCGVAVFDELRQGVKALEFLTDPEVGELRIACIETLAAGFVSAIVDQLCRQHPRAVFHLVPAAPDALIDRELRQRTVDLAVTVAPGPTLDPDVEFEFLFDDVHVVMAGARNKWVRRRGIKWEDLVNEPWVMPPYDSVVGAYIADALRASSLALPKIQVASYSIPVHGHLLATGRFITMLPLSMLHFARHLPLKALSLASPMRSRRIGIMTLKNRTLSPLAHNFIKCAREVAKSVTSRRSYPPRRQPTR